MTYFGLFGAPGIGPRVLNGRWVAVTRHLQNHGLRVGPHPTSLCDSRLVKYRFQDLSRMPFGKAAIFACNYVTLYCSILYHAILYYAILCYMSLSGNRDALPHVCGVCGRAHEDDNCREP